MIDYHSEDDRGQTKAAIASSIIPNLPPLPTGKFSLIVADPPWSYHLRESDRTHRGRCPYPPMSNQEIMDMGVEAIAAKDAYLLLWTTNNHLPVAFDVVKAWGFEYKSLHTWVKMTKAGDKIRYGVGHYGRNCTEHFLVCRRGKAPSFTAMGLCDIPTSFPSPLGPHSVKPKEFYARAERIGDALGGDRIELFARRDRDRWTSWGAEL
ncbi:MAG: MT-A70 family methyltransferase [Alphaproteobacteria bacterium]